ncbi:putative bifunctional diguanylate cyclase/phosphodiesterase [Aquabacterium sp.]|uniref:putative bifunctional diguanylate cyclase/phosphodiesterase n=1 Tax=Aquabacterium sp. TaxID=1872578 RepID=UPI0035B4DD3F
MTPQSDIEHGSLAAWGLSLRPLLAGLLVAFCLLIWQAFAFALSDAQEEAEVEASAILHMVWRAHSAGGLASSPQVLEGALQQAAEGFPDVQAASLCTESGCNARYARGRSCTPGGGWVGQCVSAESKLDGRWSVIVLHSLGPAYLEVARDVAIFLVALLLGGGVWYLSARKMRHRMAHDASRLREATEKDQLTGLFNRAAFQHALSEALQRVASTSEQFACLFINVDSFRDLNDLNGYKTGDSVLAELAERLGKVFAVPGSMLARVGGDEFAVLLPLRKNVLPDALVGDRMASAVARPFEYANRSVQITVSAAIVPLDSAQLTQGEVFRRGDIALAEAHRRGRGRCVRYDADLGARAGRRQLIQRDLRQALTGPQVYLEYQPQVDMRGQLRGVEALIRWKHPSEGMIRPDEFIPVAEETGLILHVGTRVVELACQDLVALRKDGVMLPYISVNVSPKQLADPTWPDHLLQTLKKNELSTSDLELEVTEGTVMEDGGTETSALDRLSKKGFRLAVDDFGTGYSSLARLQSMKADKLKIDRSFIRQLGDPSYDPVLVQMMLALASRLGIKSVAEGVEEQRQLDWLAAAGCQMVQGYFYAKPMTVDRLKLWIIGNLADHQHHGHELTWEPTKPDVLM